MSGSSLQFHMQSGLLQFNTQHVRHNVQLGSLRGPLNLIIYTSACTERRVRGGEGDSCTLRSCREAGPVLIMLRSTPQLACSPLLVTVEGADD